MKMNTEVVDKNAFLVSYSFIGKITETKVLFKLE